MELAGKKLHLKGHLAGNSQGRLSYGPGDLEGHLGTDGRFYVLDFARVFPPQALLPSMRYESIPLSLLLMKLPFWGHRG